MDNDEEDFCALGNDAALEIDRSTDRVRDSETSALIEIPSEFTASTARFETVSIRFISQEGFGGPDAARQAVDSALTRINGSIVASRAGSAILERDDPETALSLYNQASAMWQASLIQVHHEVTTVAANDPSSGPSIGGFGQSVPGMGSMFVMFTVLGGMITLIGEKKQWTLQRLAAMPISRASLLGGKILGRFLLGFLQYLVVFAIGIFAGLNFGRDFLALALIMISFTLAVTALSFALGTQLRSESQAAGLTNLLGLTLAPLGGAWWPLETVPEAMRIVGHISPVAWAMDGYTALLFRNGTMNDVAVPILVLFGMSLALFGLGIWRFKYD
jgi:ABC-2 type transport system permease protein